MFLISGTTEKDVPKSECRFIRLGGHDFLIFSGIVSMAIENQSNAELLAQWKSGNQLAATLLTDRYMQRLTALARSRLSRKLSRRLDADDIVLSAWRSFFIAARHSRILVPDDDNLWPLLVTMTLRKLQRQVQRHQSEKRSIGLEVPFDDTDAWQSIVSKDPTPDEAAQLTLDVESLMATLSPSEREVLTLRLQGEDFQSIATRRNCSERTVRRDIQKIRSHLIAHFGLDSMEPPASEAQLQPSDGSGNAESDSFGQPDREEYARQTLREVADAIPLRQESPTLRYDDYVLQKLIGRGGFGKVFRARCTLNGRIVALKYLNKRLWRNATAVRLLINETKKAQSVLHPQILHYQGWGMAPSGAPFLVMEFVDGPDLSRWINGSSFDENEVLTCGIQIAAALDTLHSSGLVHADLAPGNVLRRNAHDFVLADFGLSQSAGGGNLLADPMASEWMVRGGTPGFLAPEQISGSFGKVSERTDVYGLAGLLYLLITKQAPFQGNDAAETLSMILSSHAPRSNPPDEKKMRSLYDIVMRCLAKEPAYRMTTKELLASLRALTADGSRTDRQESLKDVHP